MLNIRVNTDIPANKDVVILNRVDMIESDASLPPRSEHPIYFERVAIDKSYMVNKNTVDYTSC
jgi:hypothetical protein